VTRKQGYFVLMGICLTLFILAWTIVRTVSTTWAVIMSVAALLILPVAAMVANAGDEQRPRR
jgi:cell division protein FtsW (lipid II flippase)